jgi:hypothetical protein
MKKKQLRFVALLGIVATLFTLNACDKKDDPITYPIDGEMAGTYKGKIDMTVGGETTQLPVNIVIGKVDDTHVSLKLKNFSFGDMNLGDITIASCEVQEPTNKMYPISGSQTVKLEVVGDCKVDVAGTVGNGTAALELSVETSVVGIIKVKFNGARLKGDEKTGAEILSAKILNDIDHIVTDGPTIDGKSITYKVREDATDEQIKDLEVTYEVSEGATLIVPEGQAGIILVVSEDGATINTYMLSIAGRQALLKYSFDEEWGTLKTLGKYEYPSPNPTNELGSSNGGVAILHAAGVEWAVVREEAGAKGAAVKLITRDARDTEVGVLAPLTAGTLFTGSFELNFFNPLASTKFGIPYNRKPLFFKGYYKYTPGATFLERNDAQQMVEVPDKVDTPTIMAVLYESPNGQTLDGSNIDDRDNWVAYAIYPDVASVSEWTPFELPFVFSEGKEYDPAESYKMAIVCASSKDGAKFSGAPDSTLWIDELEIVGDVPETAE